ncbi:MAG: adenylate/guanylate cyclase domain-containing protein, partial [Anaerolineales bacterium]
MTEIVQYPHPFKELPEGTVTFLFTDIEGSTQLLSQLGDRYATLLDEHHQLMRATFTQWHGREIDTQGDAFFVAFPRALDAVSCVVEAQRALVVHQWPEDVTVRVRMGLHTGEPIVSRTGYVGMDVHRAARIAHVGHGGQVLLSETTTALVIDELPEGAELLDLGRHLLKDMRRPEHIRQLVIEGLPAEFPPLTSLEHLPP